VKFYRILFVTKKAFPPSPSLMFFPFSVDSSLVRPSILRVMGTIRFLFSASFFLDMTSLREVLVSGNSYPSPPFPPEKNATQACCLLLANHCPLSTSYVLERQLFFYYRFPPKLRSISLICWALITGLSRVLNCSALLREEKRILAPEIFPGVRCGRHYSRQINRWKPFSLLDWFGKLRTGLFFFHNFFLENFFPASAKLSSPFFFLYLWGS